MSGRFRKAGESILSLGSAIIGFCCCRKVTSEQVETLLNNLYKQDNFRDFNKPYTSLVALSRELESNKQHNVLKDIYEKLSDNTLGLNTKLAEVNDIQEVKDIKDSKFRSGRTIH